MCLAVPVQITALLPDQAAVVNMNGVTTQISLALVEGVSPGDYVIVHVGYALARLNEEEAKRTLALFQSGEEG